jgi:hypothetical protein
MYDKALHIVLVSKYAAGKIIIASSTCSTRTYWPIMQVSTLSLFQNNVFFCSVRTLPYFPKAYVSMYLVKVAEMCSSADGYSCQAPVPMQTNTRLLIHCTVARTVNIMLDDFP